MGAVSRWQKKGIFKAILHESLQSPLIGVVQAEQDVNVVVDDVSQGGVDDKLIKPDQQGPKFSFSVHRRGSYCFAGAR